MLRIGKLTDYALLIVSQMAEQSTTLLSANRLATLLHLTPATVSKILKILAEKGMVTSQRGAEGGYLLAREASSISVADVIEAMEGEFAMTACCEKSYTCALAAQCVMRENWRRINGAVQSLLTKVSISDMVSGLLPVGFSYGK